MEKGPKINFLKNENIIVFGEDYGRHPHCLEHLINQLKNQNNVLWVETIGLRSPKLTIYDLKRAWEIIRKWGTKRPQEKEVSPLIISPFMIPYNRFAIIRKLNKWLVRRKIKHFLPKFNNPIIITSVPQAGDYIGDLKGKLKVYYCVDDFTNWPGHDKKLVWDLEEKLIKKCDFLMATSENLTLTRKIPGKKTELITHGVEIEHFKLPLKNIQNTPAPKFYSFGLFDERIDLKLLMDIFSKNPKFELYVIGDVLVDISSISSFKNIHFLPKVNYAELPEHIIEADFFILPYKINDLTKSINPLKIKEYLATSRPVISTPLPEVLKLKDFLYIAETSEEFINLTEKLISGEIKYDPLKTLDYLEREETWAVKASNFSKYVLDRIPL